MFSDQKWSRFVAERGRPGMDGPPPDELHVVTADLTHLQAPNFASVQDTPSIGWSVDALIDSPVAGFGAGDLLLVGPRDGGNVAVGAVAANPDTRHVFAPGIWDYDGFWRRSAGATNPWLTRIQFVGGRTVNPNAPFPLPNSVNFWSEHHSIPGAGTNPNPYGFRGRLYVPAPWIITVQTISITVDADVMNLHLRVLPVYLFDEVGAT